MLGKNDVYVQAYAKPDDSVIQSNNALPEPIVNIIIPANQTVTIPFQCQLPNDLPSSEVIIILLIQYFYILILILHG